MSNPIASSSKRPLSPPSSTQAAALGKRMKPAPSYDWSQFVGQERTVEELLDPDYLPVGETRSKLSNPPANILINWKTKKAPVSVSARSVDTSTYQAVASPRRDRDLSGPIYRQIPIQLFTVNTTFTLSNPYIDNPVFSLIKLADADYASQSLPRDPTLLESQQIYPFPFDNKLYTLPIGFHIMFESTTRRRFSLQPVANHVSTRRGQAHLAPKSYWFAKDDVDYVLRLEGPLAKEMETSMRLVEHYRAAGVLGDEYKNGQVDRGTLYKAARSLYLDYTKIVRDALLGPKFSSLEAAAEAGCLVDRIANLMDGILRVLRRSALDLCAVIGGVELPIWPPSVDMRGALVPWDAMDVPPSPRHTLVAAAERWGVPLYVINQNSRSVRLEYDRPERHPIPSMSTQEEAHQARLMRVLKGRPHDNSQAVLYVADYHHSARGTTPLQCEESRLDELIFLVMESHRPHPMPFDEFSRQVRNLVGYQMWTGKLWEAGRHGQTEGRRWYQARPRPFSVDHHAVHYCGVYVPPHYFDPTLHFPTCEGQYLQHSTSPSAVVPVPSDKWVGIEVTYLQETDQFNVMVERAYPHVYARLFARTHDSQSDGGFVGRQKPFKLEFWLKEEDKRQVLLPRIERDYPGKTVKLIETEQEGAWRRWYGYHDLEYVSFVMEHAPTMILRRGLLGAQILAPLEAVADSINYQSEVVRQRHRRRHALFCYDEHRARHMTTSQGIPAPVGVVVPVVNAAPLRTTAYSLSLTYLQNLTRASRPPELGLTDFIYLHRMEAIINLLAKIDFTVPFFRSDDGMFGRILSYIARCVIRDQAMGTECKVLPGQKLAPELVRWVKRERRIVIQLCNPNSPPPSPSREEWATWYAKEDEAPSQELQKGKHNKKGGKGKQVERQST